MEVPLEYFQSIEGIQKLLKELKQELRVLKGTDPKQLKETLEKRDLENPDAPSEAPLILGKLHVLLAYCTYALYYMYLRANGQSPNEHPVKKELLRVQSYVKKLAEIENKRSEESAKMRVNKEAADRFIKHGLAIPKKGKSGTENEGSEANSSGSAEDGEASDSDNEDEQSRRKEQKMEDRDGNKEKHSKNKAETKRLREANTKQQAESSKKLKS